MAGFSAGEAIGSGFHLIRARPGALLVWAGVYFVLGLLPQLATFGLIWPEIMAISQAGEAVAPEVSARQLMAMNAKMAIIQPIQLISSFAAMAVLYGAVFRAVLQPEDGRFGYVRFGRGELWLGLVLLIATVLLIIFMVLLILPIAIVGGIAAAMGGEGLSPAGVLILLAVMAAAGWLVIWLAVRFSLAYPMTFTEQKFLLFEAWPLTKGHAWKIFLVFLAVCAIVLVVELVLFALIGLGVVAAILAGGQDLRELSQQPPSAWMGAALAWGAVGCVALSIFAAAAYAVMIAPLASIYRELTAAP